MRLLSSIEAAMRASCTVNDEVWAAKLQKGVAVFDSCTGGKIGDVALSVDGDENVQVKQMCTVFDEVWASTADGGLVFIDAAKRKVVSTLSLPGKDKKVSLSSLSFNGHVAAVASENGNVYLIHPLRKRVTMALPLSAPCTAAAHYYSFLVAGDEEGALYVWDTLTGCSICVHTKSNSGVTGIFHETTTGTLWVSRKNRNVDVYSLVDGKMNLTGRLSALGSVTGMLGISGKVLLTTYEKKVLVADAAALTVSTLSSGSGPGGDASASHSAFIYGAVKVRHTETAQLWTFGNDDRALAWEVQGCSIAVNRSPFLHPLQQARLQLESAAHDIRVRATGDTERAEEELRQAFSQDDLRKLREETQELRLKLFKLEESDGVKSNEIASLNSRIKELNEDNGKLTKDLADASAKLSSGETERASLQTQLSKAKEELSQARTETSAKATEKSQVEQEVAKLKNEAGQLEQRLREAEGRTADLRAENSRLCNSLGGIVSGQSGEGLIHGQLVESTGKLSEELQQVRRMNLLLQSVVASMEYTIRRKEEEEKDMTALLNAFRRRVAGYVSDPFLSALLLATMVRNPERFDLECDELTKQQLMDHNGPFIHFMQTFREADPQSYEKLIQYLHQPGGSDPLSAENKQLLDQFLTLASQSGSVNDELMLAFKRSIPNFVNAATISANSANPTSSAAAGTSAGTAAATRSTPTATATPATANNNNTSNTYTMTTTATTTAAGDNKSGDNIQSNANGNETRKSSPPGTAGSLETSGDVAAYLRFLNGDKVDEAVSNSALREIQTLRAVDENFMREHKTLFEFVLKTRRTLVECLALLQKRTASAKQVVEALIASAEKTDANKNAGAQGLHKMFVGILEELVELTTTIVTKFLTSSEKQRLGI